MPQESPKRAIRQIAGSVIDVQTVDFSDKKVVFIRANGEADTTFDVKAPDANTMLQLSMGSASTEFICEKVCLIGDNANMKLSIMVNQIAKLLYAGSESRNLVISLSSKIFSTSEGSNSQDFGTMVDVLELVGTLN